MHHFKFTHHVRCGRITGTLNTFGLTLALLFVLGMAGCATTRTTSPFEPKSINEVRFRDRLQSKDDQDVRVTPSKPRSNLTGDPYFTDGLRAVIILDPGPISLKQFKNLEWERPTAFRFDILGAD